MTVRIGGGQGFYGDGLGPVPDVLEAGVEYLVCEALAELTLTILQKDRQRDESLGFTRDLPMYVRAALPYVVDGRTRFITNAGGINPVAAGRAVVTTLKEAGATGLLVATVVGDDVRPRGADLGLPPDALFANAYLGARPIVEALDAGAHVVVTGRVADASLFVAPLVHEHKWAWDDWDRLAAGVVIGHLLECSGQVAGGNYSGPWWTNPDPLRIAFPIAECEADGSAVITKPAQSGGMVTFDTVREQLLYEVHDPPRYLNPDVVADFTSLTLTDLGGDRVRVTGTRGFPAPPTYKGLVCTPAGWAGEATFAYPWPDAEAKARAAVRWVKQRAMAAKVPVDEWLEEYFGVNAFGGPTVDLDAAEQSGWEPPEVIGRLAWRCGDMETADRVSHRGLGCSGCPDRRPSPASAAPAAASPHSCSRSMPSRSTASSSTARCGSTSSRSDEPQGRDRPGLTRAKRDTVRRREQLAAPASRTTHTADTADTTGAAAGRSRGAATSFPSGGGDGGGGLYPYATFSLDAPLEVARWRPFVHWLLVIPQEIVAYVLTIVANVITFIAFFTILFTKTYPESLFNIVAMTRRYQYRVLTYALFMREPYPPFTFETLPRDPGGDPSRLSVEYPRELNRWAPLYKWFLAIPHYIVLAILGIGAAVVIFISAFVILFTGKWNEGMRKFVLGVFRWGWRVTAYVTLLRDEYPPFSLD